MLDQPPADRSETMTGNLIDQGLMLMLVGMGTVFVFLTTLVVAMRVMSEAVQRLEPAPIVAPSPDDADEVAAVAAAVEHHRRSIRR